MSLQLDTDFMSLLPEWFQMIPQFQEICSTEQQQFEALAASINQVADNMFFQTMDTDSINLWEQILNIVPNPSTESLQFRRARVLNRISTRPPFTLGFLYQKLDELIGPGAWTVTVDYPNYTLYIDAAAENQQWATEVAITINTIKPCHIIYRSRPYTNDTLFLNEGIDLSKIVWNYRLGAWLLGQAPFGQEEPMGEIKMPTQLSVQTGLLTDTATYIEGDIASARINGSVSITSLTKSTSGAAVAVSYTVTEEQASTVTLVEVLDSDGNVLTSSAVYVPISGSAIFNHTITVQEGVNTNG